MREIEFRAKDIYSGEWRYGSYTAMRELDRNNPYDRNKKVFHRIWQSPAPDWWRDFKDSIEIIGNIHENEELLTQNKD